MFSSQLSNLNIAEKELSSIDKLNDISELFCTMYWNRFFVQFR